MVNHQPCAGVWVPALTPFNPDRSVNREAFVDHCRWLLDEGADGLAVFGTTSEASSLTLRERMELLEALTQAGIPAHKLMPGVGCCAVGDTVRLCRHALDTGCTAVLMLPPFYYKGISDEGLYDAFESVIQQVASRDLRIFLYHIPPVSRVALSPALISRLREAYSGQIAGLKDSGGDWSYTREVLERFPDMAVFAGSERYLLDTLRNDGAGCITASANVNPAGIRKVYEKWREGDSGVDTIQAGVTGLRDVLEQYPMIPALKALCARIHNDEIWSTVRPPLRMLADSSRRELLRQMETLGLFR